MVIQRKRYALLFAFTCMLTGPVVLHWLAQHMDRLVGVYELAPTVVACLTLFGIVYGIKRAWRIFRAERDELVRERVRQRMRRRYNYGSHNLTRLPCLLADCGVGTVRLQDT